MKGYSLNIFYCQILHSNGVGSHVLTTLVTTLPLPQMNMKTCVDIKCSDINDILLIKTFILASALILTLIPLPSEQSRIWRVCAISPIAEPLTLHGKYSVVLYKFQEILAYDVADIVQQSSANNVVDKDQEILAYDVADIVQQSSANNVVDKVQ